MNYHHINWEIVKTFYRRQDKIRKLTWESLKKIVGFHMKHKLSWILTGHKYKKITRDISDLETVTILLIIRVRKIPHRKADTKQYFFKVRIILCVCLKVPPDQGILFFDHYLIWTLSELNFWIPSIFSWKGVTKTTSMVYWKILCYKIETISKQSCSSLFLFFAKKW